MVWIAGKPRSGHATGLTQEEEDLLNEIMYQRGIFEGVHGLHHRLVDELGAANAPARREVGEWLKKQPSAQIARVPRKHKSIAPVLPSPTPLSIVFIDTAYFPRCSHRAKVYRKLTVYVCALTKFVYLQPIAETGATFSQQVWAGFLEFRRRARNEANDQDLHVRTIRCDSGPEHFGTFETNRAALEAAHPGNYTIKRTPGSRTAHAGMVEATIKAIRRLYHGRYRAVKMDWDANNIPQGARNFNWAGDHNEDIIDMWQTGYHHTIKTQPIKAIRPGVAPNYNELQTRILAYARKRYGTRVDSDTGQPGFSGPGILPLNQLVRVKKWKDGSGVGNLQWSNLKNKTADNVWSVETFRIVRVLPGRGMSATSYMLQEMDGTNKDGTWSRQQLLPIPEETLALIETDEDDSDEELEEELNQPRELRPRVGHNMARYRIGDRLHFDANYFSVGQFASLTPPIVRDRVGTITQAPDRSRLFAVGRRLYYTIRFDNEATIRLPRNTVDGIDNDDDVTYAG